MRTIIFIALSALVGQHTDSAPMDGPSASRPASVTYLWTSVGSRPGQHLGIAATAIADLDSDGFSDPVVGGIDIRNFSGEPGIIRAYSSKGGSVIWEQSGSRLGLSLTSKIENSAVAATRFFSARTDPAYVYGFQWSAPKLTPQTVEIRSGESGSVIESFSVIGTPYLGQRAFVIHDLTRDDVGELALSDGKASNEDSQKLVICCVPTGKVLRRVGGRERKDSFGECVVSIDDLDGDRVGDIAVSAPNRTTAAGRMAGAVEIVSGTSLETIMTLEGDEAFGHFGSSMCTIPKSSSTPAMLAVCSRGTANPGPFAGKVSFYSLPKLGREFEVLGIRQGSEFGASVAYFQMNAGSTKPMLAVGAEHGASSNRSAPFTQIIDVQQRALLQVEYQGGTPTRLSSNDPKVSDRLLLLDPMAEDGRGIIRCVSP